MPRVRYRLQVLDDVFEEEDYILPTEDVVKSVAEQIVHPLQEHRAKLGEPAISLLEVKVVNPFVHPHEWKLTHKAEDWWFYRCTRCGVVAHRVFHIIRGLNGEYLREADWKAAKYELCRDPLKEMPTVKSLFK